MGRFTRAIGEAVADGSATFHEHDVKGGSVTPGAAKYLRRRHGAAEAAADNHDRRRATRDGMRALAGSTRPRQEAAEVFERRRVHVNRHQRLARVRRVAHAVNAGILARRHFARLHPGLVFQVHVAVRGDHVTALDRFPLYDLHRADGSSVVVGDAGLPGKPGHHEQLIVFPPHDGHAIVAALVCLNVGCDIGRRQFRRRQHLRHPRQRSPRAQGVEFPYQIVEPTVQVIHHVSRT